MIRKLIALLLLTSSALLLWYVFGNQDQLTPSQRESQAEDPYAPRDWEQERESSLNISLYTFRDRNRNGVHDQGDMPMASVLVQLTAPDGTEHSSLSNINGYANFKMALGNTSHPVNQAGTYQFQVQQPPKWQVTSGNAEQEITFRALPGSVAELVAEQPPRWVGLAPDLSIALLTANAAKAPAQAHPAKLVSPDGESHTLAATGSGLPNAAAYPGRWLLITGNEQRSVIVTDAPVSLMPPTPQQAGLAPLAHTVVENFDWLQRSIIEKIANGHLTLNWDYLLAVHNQEYRGPGYVNGLTSGHAVAYNSSGHPVTISAPAGEYFDFVGGYFSLAWPASEGEVLEITAWREGELVSSSRLTLSYLGPIWLDADLRRIDRLTLATSHYWQFVVDDLMFRLAQPHVD